MQKTCQDKPKSKYYTYKITIKGSTDNEKIEKTGAIVADTSPPSFDEWIIPDITGDSIIISVNVSDASNITTTKLQYGIASTENEIFPDIVIWTDFGTGSNGTLELNWADYDGKYLYIRAYAEDEHGNVIYSQIQKKHIIEGEPCDAAAKFTAITDELTVTFNTSESVGVLSFDYGDNTAGTEITHTYAVAGTYNVILTAADTINNCTDIQTVSIKVPCGAVAIFTANPVNGNAPLTINFDASASSGDIYEWIFGDCSEKGIGQIINHTYEYAGIYEVILSVKDNNGCIATQKTEITVSGEYALGNADGRGCVDIYDALLVALYDVGLKNQNELSGFAVADADCNGTVNIFDALRIAEFDADDIPSLECNTLIVRSK